MKLSMPMKVSGGAITVALPMSYMIAKHLSWEPYGAHRVQMGFRQLGFWGGMVAAVVLLHRNRGKGFLLKSLLLGFIPIVGYEVATFLAPKVFPEKSPGFPDVKPLRAPQQVAWTSIYAPSVSTNGSSATWSIPPQRSYSPGQYGAKGTYALTYNAILNMPPARSPFGYLLYPGAKMGMGQGLRIS